MVPALGLFFDKYGWRMPFGESESESKTATQTDMTSIDRSRTLHRRLRPDRPDHRPSDRSYRTIELRPLPQCPSFHRIHPDLGQ
jgi:hypothetical protein